MIFIYCEQMNWTVAYKGNREFLDLDGDISRYANKITIVIKAEKKSDKTKK